MNINLKSAIIALLVVSLLVSACGSPATASPAVSPLPTAPPEGTAAPTRAPEVTPTEEPEGLYAGFTGEAEFPFFVAHKSGESVVLFHDPDTKTMQGLVWTAPNQEPIIVYTGENGLPRAVVVGENILTYSNYTAETVDLTWYVPNGNFTNFIAVKLDPRFMPKPGTSTNFSRSRLKAKSHLVAGLEESDAFWAMLDLTVIALGTAMCLGAYMTTHVGLIAACGGTILTVVLTALEVNGIHIVPPELGLLYSLVQCRVHKKISECYEALIGAAKEIKKIYDELVVNNPAISEFVFPELITQLPPPAEPLTLRLEKNYFCRSGPGRAYSNSWQFETGAVLNILGTDGNGWYEVEVNDPRTNRKSCWIGGGIVQGGDPESIPLSKIPPPPDKASVPNPGNTGNTNNNGNNNSDAPQPPAYP